MADIVLVEDEDVLRRYLAGTLQRLEHSVRAAETAEEGLRFIEEGEPDIVLSDYRLPGMTGYEVARELRARGRFDHTVIVAISGYGQKEDRRKASAVGIDRYVIKPLDFGSMHQILRWQR